MAGLIGGIDRWRTMPWMVLVFGLAVGPLGLVSVLALLVLSVWFGVLDNPNKGYDPTVGAR